MVVPFSGGCEILKDSGRASNPEGSAFRWFLGGLSLHLNHLIGSRMRISFRSFETLPIGILFSNLGSGQLMTCPRTLFGQI